MSQAMDVSTFLGPIVLGAVLSGVAFGCALVQTYTYCRTFSQDKTHIKALVALEMLLQATHLTLLMAALWHMVVSIYGDRYALSIYSDPMVGTIIVCSPITLASQAFFTFRLWKFSKRAILFAPCLFLTVSRFALNLSFGIAVYRIRDIVTVVHEWWWCITAIFITSIACDTTVAAALTYSLSTEKTGFKKTSWIIDKMIMYAVATGIATTAGELAQALCFWTMPHNYIWLGFFAVESGLYTNSLLAALNSRAVISQMWTYLPSGGSANSGTQGSHSVATAQKRQYSSAWDIYTDKEYLGPTETPLEVVQPQV